MINILDSYKIAFHKKNQNKKIYCFFVDCRIQLLTNYIEYDIIGLSDKDKPIIILKEMLL